MNRSGGGTAGFTLLEVLAALAVLGLVIALLSQGVRFGLQASRHGNRLAADADAGQIADGKLLTLVMALQLRHPSLFTGPKP
jgi:prepilin-type N-terminal cleavage/methylation domain-containing protein